MLCMYGTQGEAMDEDSHQTQKIPICLLAYLSEDILPHRSASINYREDTKLEYTRKQSDGQQRRGQKIFQSSMGSLRKFFSRK